MRKTAMVFATAAIALTATAAPRPAEAHWRGGFGPGLAGGLIAGAVIGGIASSAYAYGPGYGYAGYAPAYYGGYDPYPWGGHTTTYYTTGYAPAYYGYRYRRVVRPAYAYLGGPFPHFYHHRWHRHW